MCARPRAPSPGIKRWARSSSSTPTPGASLPRPPCAGLSQALIAPPRSKSGPASAVPHAPRYGAKSLIPLMIRSLVDKLGLAVFQPFAGPVRTLRSALPMAFEIAMPRLKFRCPIGHGAAHPARNNGRQLRDELLHRALLQRECGPPRQPAQRYRGRRTFLQIVPNKFRVVRQSVVLKEFIILA